MHSAARKLLIYSANVLGVGTVLILASHYMQEVGHYSADSSGGIVLGLVSHLGTAMVVASLVAVIIERSLSEQHLERIGQVLGHHQELQRAGFRSVYPNRQQFFDHFFDDVLKRVKHELKIMGICVSLFKEADRPQRNGEWNREVAIRTLRELVERGCKIKILFLKRYPSEDELKKYGVSENADFFYMRERDEDSNADFRDGDRLKIIANTSLGCWIQVLVELAAQIHDRPEDERREILNRLQIREYIALPSLSLHIADDQIFVTPYLCKRHCSTVPAFEVEGKNTDLFRAYNTHFDATWNDAEFSTSAIDRRFVDLLWSDPKKTTDLFRQQLNYIERQEKGRVNEDLTRSRHPEHYRSEEFAVMNVLHEVDRLEALERLAGDADAQKLRESGRLARFVTEHGGTWQHADWQALLQDLRKKGFYNLSDTQIGYLLDEERTNYKGPIQQA